MSEGSPLSSEPEPFANRGEAITRTITGSGGAHFPLTLPRLQLVYNQTRDSLLEEAQAISADPCFARDSVQEAFAAAAKNRFSFPNEQAAVAWLRREISSRTDYTGAPGVPTVGADYDWADVMRRANISTSTPAATANAEPSTSRKSMRAALRLWARRTNLEGESDSSLA